MPAVGPNPLIVVNAGMPGPVKVIPISKVPVMAPPGVNVDPLIVHKEAVAITDDGTACELFNKLKLRVSLIGY